MASTNSSVHESAKIYRDVRLDDSTVERNCTIADDCDLVDVCLDEYAELGRRNLVRHSKIGRGSYTGTNVIIKNSEIGKYCCLAWNISIGGRSHDYTSVSIYTPYWWKRVFGVSVEETRKEATTCTIGNDVWIGAGANIVSGVTVGNGAVIAAGAVVVKDVEPYSVVAGVPAKTMKYRFSPEVIEGLERLQWWNWEPEKIAQLAPLLNAADFDEDALEELISASEAYDDGLEKNPERQAQ